MKIKKQLLKIHILKVVLMLVLVSVTCIAVVWFSPLDPDNYLGAMQDKVRSLAETPSPRIILVGGSNVAFGFNGGIIRKKLGYNTVNMGLHLGLGLRFTANALRTHAREGDVIIFSPEYQITVDGANTFLEMLLCFPGGFSYMSPRLYLTCVKTFQDTARRRFEGFIRHFFPGNQVEKSDPVYNRRAFNRSGDLTADLGPSRLKRVERREKLIVGRIRESSNYDGVIEFLNRLHADLAPRKVNMFYSYPPLPESAYLALEPKLKGIGHRLENRLAFPVLGKPRDYAFSKKHIYDTLYHLNKRGKRARTLRLIRFLKDKIPMFGTR